ncbi:regulatory protein RecX [Shewanella baltica]|uniref:Regulatory protein RecX n=1 Tax=Shewanella baltica (strain OS155 / ATCC BAA-1091) TaxID=325240 RepID=A3DB26_SHEB5|nr:regulatory protein RecX [Shewanella baltica]ABN63939.1 hypothetical protein Sbal_4386 [Shewanella baltica OS155]
MNAQELYDHAVSLLAKRDYSSGELSRTLLRMTENSECVDSALQRLIVSGYLDDERLVIHLVDKHIRKKHGPTRIRQEVRQKGFWLYASLRGITNFCKLQWLSTMT